MPEHNRLFARFSLDHVYLAAAAITALPALARPVSPHDFWWHLALGRQIVETGQVPRFEAFSFTHAGEPFFDQGWLAQVLFYGIHQAGGLPLVVLAQALLITAAYGMLLWLAVRRSGRIRLPVALLLLGVGPLSYGNWMLRPQSWALPLFAGFLVLLTGYRLRWWRVLWPLPLGMLAWVNLHGSFVLGLALIALVLAAEGVRRVLGDDESLTGRELLRLAVAGAATAAAALANPRGAEVFGYVRDLASSKVVTSLISEWAAPTVKDPGGAGFFLFAVGLFTALAYARRRVGFTDLVLALSFFWLAAGTVRSILWFAMVAFPLLSETLAARMGPEEPRPGIGWLNAVLAGALLCLPVLAFPTVRSGLPLRPEARRLVTRDTPVEAVAWLRALPPEERPRRLFHDLGFGAYLIWAAPEQPVFVDPRIELYPEELHRDCVRLNLGCDVEERLAKYRIDGLLLNRHTQRALERRALDTGRWRLARENEDMALLLPAGRLAAPR